jgi:hypothetical protein
MIFRSLVSVTAESLRSGLPVVALEPRADDDFLALTALGFDADLRVDFFETFFEVFVELVFEDFLEIFLEDFLKPPFDDFFEAIFDCFFASFAPERC